MTYSKRVSLLCDGEGKDNGFDGCTARYEYDRGSAMEAREYAKKDGWMYRSGEDYCPECSGND